MREGVGALEGVGDVVVLDGGGGVGGALGGGA